METALSGTSPSSWSIKKGKLLNVMPLLLPLLALRYMIPAWAFTAIFFQCYDIILALVRSLIAHIILVYACYSLQKDIKKLLEVA